MAGEGQILHKAREAKGWSLMDAEEATKIRVRYLQALEEEKYAILPGAAYSKGFLRTYANHLGLDPEEMIGLYKASAIAEAQPVLQTPMTPIKNRPIWLRPAVAMIMSCLAIGFFIGMAHFSHSPGQVASSGYTPSPLPSAPKPQQPAKASIPAASPPQKSPNQAVSSSAGATAPDSSATASDSTVATNDGLIAKLVFTQDVWLSLKVDGEAPVQQYYYAGTTQEIKANNMIELLTIGNAGGVSITVNGKPIPPLGAPGQVKNNIIFDKTHFG